MYLDVLEVEYPAGSYVSVGTQTEAFEPEGAMVREMPEGIELALAIRPLMQGMDVSTQTDGTRAKPPLHGKPKATSSSNISPSTADSSENSSMEQEGQSEQDDGLKATPRRKRLSHIRDTLRHWNLERADFCCPFHQTVMALEGVVDKLRRERCNPLWSAFTGVQCPKCYAMNDLDVQGCLVCGKPVAFEGSGSGGGSSGSRGRSSKAPKQTIVEEDDDESLGWMRPLDVAVLKRFPVTPMQTCLVSFLKVTRHWNVRCPPDVEPCCPFHSHALVAIALAEYMDGVACGMCDNRCCGWSCPTCLATNDEDQEQCSMCGFGYRRSFGISPKSVRHKAQLFLQQESATLKESL
mmetsp:Transcript_2029/g.5338  ORF Transcript_2029/g.5338 Transcript_2029/m.5338 type:complete len:351 (-) Transcript_2029:138-1190(-)